MGFVSVIVCLVRQVVEVWLGSKWEGWKCLCLVGWVVEVYVWLACYIDGKFQYPVIANA